MTRLINIKIHLISTPILFNTITYTLKLLVLRLKWSFELLFLQLDPGENSILNEQCSELYDNRPDERPNRNGEQNDAADFDRRSYKLEPR